MSDERRLRTNLNDYGNGELDGSRPCDVAKMRPIGRARFGMDSVGEFGDEFRRESEDKHAMNRGSHDEDPCQQFNDQLGHGRLCSRVDGE